jgi:hypothetical protein
MSCREGAGPRQEADGTLGLAAEHAVGHHDVKVNEAAEQDCDCSGGATKP